MAPPSGVKPADSSDTSLELPVFDTKLEVPVLDDKKSGITFQRLTLDTSLFTDDIRKRFEATTIFPKGLFLGPMTSDITVKGRADWGWLDPTKGPSFFTSFGGGKFKTDGAPNASGYFLQAGFGVVRNKPTLLGFDSQDGQYDFGVGGGLQTLGLGFNFYNFDQIDGAPVVRLDAIDESSFLHARFKGFHLGLKFFTTQSGINFGGADIPKCEGKFCSTKDYVPASSIEPLSFTLSYDFNPSMVEAKDRDSLYPGEAYTMLYGFAAQTFSSHLTLQRASQLVGTRILLEAAPQGSVDSPATSGTARWALNLFQAKTSWTYGSMAADLEYGLLRANNTEKWILGTGKAATTLGLCLSMAGSKKGDDYFSDFSGRASRIACFNSIEGDALGLLGGFGLLGKPNGGTTDKALFWTSHAIFLAVGVVGLVNYWRPFGEDPDSIAYTGGTGVIDPFKMAEDMENRLLLGTLLTTPGMYAVNSWLNLKNFKLGAFPVEGGGVATAAGKF